MNNFKKSVLTYSEESKCSCLLTRKEKFLVCANEYKIVETLCFTLQLIENCDSFECFFLLLFTYVNVKTLEMERIRIGGSTARRISGNPSPV